jgi:hypothetical protein
MAECQSRRVKCLSRRSPLDRLGRPPGRPGDPAAPAAGVDRIADYRMPDVLEVHSDLMSAAGVELKAQEIHDLETRGDVGVGSGGAAVRGHCHPLAIGRMTRERRFDDRGAVRKMSPGERRIGAMHPPRRERGTQAPVR